MDQSSFRSLLSTGNASASSSKPVTGRAAGILGGQTLKRGYGSGGSKKTTNFAPKNKDAEAEGSSGGKSKPAFVPRAAKKDNKYKDRAELRRTGEDDEYKPMQKMLEDFETRAKAEGEDEETLAERRAMLGGDASHSILVKGLDYALLAAKKAEIAAKEGDKLDDEFDEFLERDVQPTQPDEDSVPKKGKSRDEIMEALKASRKRLASLHGAGGGEDDRDSKRAKVEVEEKPQGLGSKFKSLAKKREEEEARRQKEAEGKKKKKKRKVKAVYGEDVGYPDASAVAGEVPVDGEVKPKKKKKKKVEMEMPPHAAIATSASMQDISAVEISGHEVVPPPRHVEPQQPAQDSPAVNLPPSASDIAAAPTPPPAASIPPSDSPSPSPAPAVDMEVDDDIFGDAGDYNPGLSEVSSDDDGEDEKDEKDGKEREAPATAKKGRGWFGDEEEEAPGKEVDPILSTVLQASKSSTSAAAETIDAAEPLSRSPSPDPILPGQSLRRLEPLASSSGPSARELLERAKYEEEQDKRRSKKAAWRAKQGLSKQDTGDDDDDEGYRKKDDDNDKHEKRRRTREMQQLQAHMTKKGMM